MRFPGNQVSAYRNSGSKTYHLPAEDYIHSGRAMCGRDIGRAGFSMRQGDVDDLRRTAGQYGKRLCKDCVRRHYSE